MYSFSKGYDSVGGHRELTPLEFQAMTDSKRDAFMYEQWFHIEDISLNIQSGSTIWDEKDRQKYLKSASDIITLARNIIVAAKLANIAK